MNSVEIEKKIRELVGLSDKGLSCNRKAWRRNTMVAGYM